METDMTNDTSMLNLKKFIAAQSESIVVTQYCPERPYVELRIPSELEVIRRIVFKITSHDQGDENVNHLEAMLITFRFQR
jgi:hypothetical protein